MASIEDLRSNAGIGSSLEVFILKDLIILSKSFEVTILNLLKVVTKGLVILFIFIRVPEFSKFFLIFSIFETKKSLKLLANVS